MKFLRLTMRSAKDGDVAELVGLHDISFVREVQAPHANTMIALISNPEVPLWVTETVNEVEEFILGMGSDVYGLGSNKIAGAS